MMTVGMKFKSTLSPWFVGTCRRVSTSVSERLPKNGSSPRKFVRFEPLKKLVPGVDVGLFVLMFCGICFIASPALTMPRFCKKSLSMTVVGVGEVKSSRRMRVPVTVISSILLCCVCSSRSCA